MSTQADADEVRADVPTAMRRVALATMIVAVGLLVVTLLTRPTDETASAGPSASAADADGDTTGDAGPNDAPASATALPTSTATPNPFAVSSQDASLTVSRLWSPAPNVARAEGTVTGAGRTVTASVDGHELPVVEIVVDGNGYFEVDIVGLRPGPQEICIDTACGRVLVADPDTGDDDAVVARIEEALDRVEARLDLEALIPGWTVQVGGPSSSIGGTANADTEVISIDASSGRSVDDYEITLLHVIGHAVDDVWMSDEQRDDYRALRGHAADLPWGQVDPLAVGDERWRNSAEDFAEVFVTFVLGNDYAIMSGAAAPQPTDDELRAFCEIVAAAPLDCG